MEGKTDPGWKRDLFHFEGTGGHCFGDYSCPDDVGAGGDVSKSCSSEQNPVYLEFAGPQSYMDQFKDIAQIPINGQKEPQQGGFQGSSSYQKVIDGTRNDYEFQEHWMQCKTYQIQTADNPHVNQSFYAEVEDNMPTEYDADTQAYFVNFMDVYGTHFVYQAQFGCIEGQLSQMTRSNYSQFASSNLDLHYASTFSVWSANHSQKLQGDAFRNACAQQFNITRGSGIPDAHNGYSGWQDRCTKDPTLIAFSLKTIDYGLEASAFKEIHDIGDKRGALKNAIIDYCHTYTQNQSSQGVTTNCTQDGWPTDGDMPKASIVLGFYGDFMSGWDEPANLWTGKHQCRSDCQSQVAFNVINPANPAETQAIRMCLVSEDEKKDPFDYFGGMYGDGQAPVDNYFTGARSCPLGMADFEIMACGDEYPDLCVKPHVCYNKQLALSDSIIGGFYTEATQVEKGKTGCETDNPYTGKQTCPENFTAFTLATTY